MENRKNVKMRGPTPNRVIVFAGAVVLGGWFGGWSVGLTPAGEEKEIRQRRAVGDIPHPRATGDELLQLAREAVEKWTQPGFDPVAGELADWTDAEIRDALNESLTDPHAALTGWAGTLPERGGRNRRAGSSWIASRAGGCGDRCRQDLPANGAGCHRPELRQGPRFLRSHHAAIPVLPGSAGASGRRLDERALTQVVGSVVRGLAKLPSGKMGGTAQGVEVGGGGVGGWKEIAEC